MDVATLTPTAQENPTGQSSSSSFGALQSQDFFELIITDLLNQDPLSPTDNDKLLQQISSIREIEANSEITNHLKSLLGQEHIGASATLIGKYVVGMTQAQANTSGTVVGLRFDTQGQPILKLGNGEEVSLSQLESVSSIEHISNSLVGKQVQGQLFDGTELKTVQGVVTEVKSDHGQIMLELDSGVVLPLANVQDFGTVL